MRRLLSAFALTLLIPQFVAARQIDLFDWSEADQQSVITDPIAMDFITWPQTILVDEDNAALSLPQLRYVGRMSEGILYNWVEKRNRGVWFECGLRYETVEEKEEAATLWAFQIVRAALQHEINPWGLAGTIANESNFDRCAIGYHPRTWALQKNMLKRKRRTISYAAEEVITVYRSIAARKRWSHTGWDVGPCQMLSRFYPGNIEDMFSLMPGIDICAMEMRSRGDMYRTDRGWRWWRGTETDWYDDRITRFARLMGASKEEI